MGSVDYKYNIRERIDKMPHANALKAETFLPKYLGMSKRSWRKYKDVRLDEVLEISGVRLIKLAVFFDCEPKELFNTSIDKKEMEIKYKKFTNENFPEHVYSTRFDD